MEGATTPFALSHAALLFWTVALPLVAAVLMMSGGLSRRLAQWIAAIGFGAPLIGALRLASAFADAPRSAGYAFAGDMGLGMHALGISLKLGLNGISMPLFVMAAVVGFAAGLYAIGTERERQPAFLSLLLVMQGGLLGLFASVALFYFYFFHELALIPTFLMIGIWGGRSRRIAAIEMTIYLTVGAMLVLAGLIALYAESGAQSFDFVAVREAVAREGLAGAAQHYILGLLLFGFGILVSLFPFHTWAPRGYANAPASTAMLHAGVLKKFGLYGLIQIAAPLLPEGASAWVDVLLWLAMGNIIVVGLITMAKRDLREMLGYGSVMHMGYAFAGLATLSAVGVGGAVLMLFAHGCSIAALFLLADCVARRGGTADMDQFGGMARQAPVLAALFTAAILASIGLPGFANFWGELGIFVALFASRPWFGAVAVLGIIISAIYGLRAVASIFFGEPTAAFAERNARQAVGDLSVEERAPVLILLGALLLVGLWPRSIGDQVNAEVSALYPAQQSTLTVATTDAAAADEAPAETGDSEPTF